MYYVSTVGDIVEEAINQKYIQNQSEELRKEDSKGASFWRQLVKILAILAFKASK
jgi:hypothetical protein